ncbi:hypothetical protein RYX36_020224 [Vicia faba]
MIVWKLRSCFSSHLKAAFLHLSEKSFIISLNSSYRLRFFTVDSFPHFPITIHFTTPFFLLSLPSSRYPNQLCAKFQSTLFLCEPYSVQTNSTWTFGFTLKISAFGFYSGV